MARKSLAIFNHTTRKLCYLLISLVILLIIYPFLAQGSLSRLIFEVYFSLVLLLSIYAVSYDQRHLIVGICLGLPTLVVSYAKLLLPYSLDLLNHILHAAFYLYIVFAILAYVINSRKITTGLIYGALCAYLILGVAFASLFSVVEITVPGSFEIANLATLSWFDFLYYSFTTLTTLGYGDIVPISLYAQSLALIEAVIGVLFIAVLIARLVGMYSNQKR